MATTANYGWTKPTVGGDSGAWGTILNNLFDAADSSLKTVENLANSMLQKAGGTMTGRLNVLTSSVARYDFGGISGSVVVNLAVAQTFTLTVAGALALSFSNVPSGTVTSSVSMLITNGGAFAVTWPAGVKWHNGTPPTLTVSGKDHIAFVTYDGGTTWYGVVVGQALA